VDAISIELPSVNLAVVVDIHLVKELVKLLLHHSFIHVSMTLDLFPHPSFKLPPFQNAAFVTVVLAKDVAHKLPAI